MTARSWPITLRWTAVAFPPRSASFDARAFLSAVKTNSSYCNIGKSKRVSSIARLPCKSFWDMIGTIGIPRTPRWAAFWKSTEIPEKEIANEASGMPIADGRREA